MKPAKKPITDKDVKEYLRDPWFLKWQIVVACLQMLTFFLFCGCNFVTYWVTFDGGHASTWLLCRTQVLDEESFNEYQYIASTVNKSVSEVMSDNGFYPCESSQYCRKSCDFMGLEGIPEYIHCTRILMSFTLLFYIINVTCGYTSSKTRSTSYTFVQEHWANVVGFVGSMPGISGVIFFNVSYDQSDYFSNPELGWAFYLSGATMVLMILWFPIKVLPYSMLKRKQRLRDISLSQYYNYTSMNREDRRFGSAKLNGIANGIDSQSGNFVAGQQGQTLEEQYAQQQRNGRARSDSLAIFNNSVFFGRRRSSASNYSLNQSIYHSENSGFLLGANVFSEALNSRRNSSASPSPALRRSHPSPSHSQSYMTIESGLLWTNRRPGRRLPNIPSDRKPMTYSPNIRGNEIPPVRPKSKLVTRGSTLSTDDEGENSDNLSYI